MNQNQINQEIKIIKLNKIIQPIVNCYNKENFNKIKVNSFCFKIIYKLFTFLYINQLIIN
jgi:hypothetical protein